MDRGRHDKRRSLAIPGSSYTNSRPTPRTGQKRSKNSEYSQPEEDEDLPEGCSSTVSDEDIDLHHLPRKTSEDVISRQLSYSLLPPDFLLPPDPMSESSSSLICSLSNSSESVVGMLELDTEEVEVTEDPIQTEEEIEDETESQDEEYEEEEFVNVRVKVEKRPYQNTAMRVTVSVQPPSEADEDESELISDALSEDGDESEESDDEEESVDGENVSIEDDSGENDDIKGISEEGGGESELIRQRVESPDGLVERDKETPVGRVDEKEEKTEIIDPNPCSSMMESETDKIQDLLCAAIDQCEKSKTKIIQQGSNIVGVAPNEFLTASAGVEQAMSNAIGGGVTTASSKIVSAGIKKTCSGVGNTAAEVSSEISTQIVQINSTTQGIEKSVEGSSILNVDKGIAKEASNLRSEIDSGVKNAISTGTSKTEKVDSVLIPRLVVANVLVHKEPTTNQNETQDNIASESSEVNHQSPNQTAANCSFKNEDAENDFNEKEDYLSICEDTTESSEADEEEDSSTKKITKEETEQDRKAVELAKDKLLEEWKSARQQSIDDLDERFPHILEDMIAELQMEPVIPVLPKELKEAVKVTDESPQSDTANGSASTIESNEEKKYSNEYLNNDGASSSVESFDLDHPQSQAVALYNIVSSYGFVRKHRPSSSSKTLQSSKKHSSESSSANSQRSLSSQGSSQVLRVHSSKPEMLHPNSHSSTPAKVSQEKVPAQHIITPKKEPVKLTSKPNSASQFSNKSETFANNNSHFSPASSASELQQEQVSSASSSKPSLSQLSQESSSVQVGHEEILEKEERDFMNLYKDYPISELPMVEDSISRNEDSPLQQRKWKNSTEIASTLSHYLFLVKPQTIEDSVTEIIPFLTKLLVTFRKNKTEHALSTLIASLSAVRVLCERFHHVRLLSGQRALRNVDLSWLIRILCKINADPNSKIKPESGFTLARLVKCAGPELITRPIYFLLVMENDGFSKGSKGSRTKAAALDTLTYALLSFPKEEFEDLEEIARWVCLVVMHPHRRVRQAALECIAVIGNHLGSPDAAVARIRAFIVREVELNYQPSESDGEGHTKSAIRTFDGKGIFDVSAITAISTRIRKRIPPLPSPHGLVEYGVKVPTGQQLVLILTKMQDEEDEEFEGSTTEESVAGHNSTDDEGHDKSDSESIRMSDLEQAAKEERAFGKKPRKHLKIEKNEDDVELITPDVAYILAGKGKVNKQTDEVEAVPENPSPEVDAKEKKRRALKKKLRKKREIERTYSEYEDDSPENEND